MSAGPDTEAFPSLYTEDGRMYYRSACIPTGSYSMVNDHAKIFKKSFIQYFLNLVPFFCDFHLFFTRLDLEDNKLFNCWENKIRKNGYLNTGYSRSMTFSTKIFVFFSSFFLVFKLNYFLRLFSGSLNLS